MGQSPRGGIGIHSRLRACVRKDVLVRVQSGAYVNRVAPARGVPLPGRLFSYPRATICSWDQPVLART